MEQPAKRWTENVEYRRFWKLVNGITVVNDASERAVQDVTQYAEYSRDPARRERVVMVVNHHRELHDFVQLTKDELSLL